MKTVPCRQFPTYYFKDKMTTKTVAKKATKKAVKKTTRKTKKSK